MGDGSGSVERHPENSGREETQKGKRGGTAAEERVVCCTDPRRVARGSLHGQRAPFQDSEGGVLRNLRNEEGPRRVVVGTRAPPSSFGEDRDSVLEGSLYPSFTESSLSRQWCVCKGRSPSTQSRRGGPVHPVHPNPSSTTESTIEWWWKV